MKTISYIVLLALLLIGCNQQKVKKNCIRSKVVSIEYNTSLELDATDSLYIDDLVFRHTKQYDSLSANHLLPTRVMIHFDTGTKQITSKSNKIDLARALARKLKASGNYTILNGPELITTGILKISRTDEEQILICNSEGYTAKIEPLP